MEQNVPAGLLINIPNMDTNSYLPIGNICFSLIVNKYPIKKDSTS